MPDGIVTESIKEDAKALILKTGVLPALGETTLRPPKEWSLGKVDRFAG